MASAFAYWLTGIHSDTGRWQTDGMVTATPDSTLRASQRPATRFRIWGRFLLGISVLVGTFDWLSIWELGRCEQQRMKQTLEELDRSCGRGSRTWDPDSLCELEQLNESLSIRATMRGIE